jgi:RNA polymerase sigma-70 factor (ECF subfamily)
MFTARRIDFEGIASRYSPVLFRVALRRLRNVEDAEDAVQDALLSAYKNIGQFEGRSQLSSWLTRIVINAAGMKLRTRTRHEVVSLDQGHEDNQPTLANELVYAGASPEKMCAQTEMEELLRRALAQMSAKLRVAFQLCEIAELSTREAAETLRIKTTTLKSRVKRARAAVGQYLDQSETAKSADEVKAPVVTSTPEACRRRNAQTAPLSQKNSHPRSRVIRLETTFTANRLSSPTYNNRRAARCS